MVITSRKMAILLFSGRLQPSRWDAPMAVRVEVQA
jgi:hypothetical protein